MERVERSPFADWNLLHYHPHEGVRRLVRDLNFTYRSKPALHARDCEGEGFEWLIADDSDNSSMAYAWLRKAPGEKPVAVITNFTPVYRENYRVPLPKERTLARSAEYRCRKSTAAVARVMEAGCKPFLCRRNHYRRGHTTAACHHHA